MFENCWVRYLKLDSGEISIIDHQVGEFSRKDLRRAYKRFRGDGDVLECCTLPADRFFSSKSEMTKYFKNRT